MYDHKNKFYVTQHSIQLLFIQNTSIIQKFDQNFRKFLEKVSVTEMENQIQHKKYTKLSQICSHLQTPWPFLKTARVSVFEQGWVSQFEVMQYFNHRNIQK
ncbi:Hypothetical_protein [Hexamita inflata]|uniref:Hypothetical_protein n=1 Tax=Hexamita inflata TaxID=28002 RepID=A0AA86UD06_9EUKA|nr:Hypothetical protein HINF_LOCUS24723 [Hexamita inflata]